MPLPDPETFRQEMDRAMADLRALSPDPPETDFKKGIAKHPWLLFGLVSVLLVLIGGLMGRVANTDDREHAEFREAIKSLQTMTGSLDRRIESQEKRVADYGDTSEKALRLMTELAQERYETYRAAAIARGDDAAVRRINRKLTALNESKGGQ